jgi:predicted Zn-dependent protease with MMP-like domain/Flp pilus assembly protein TadD
VRQPGDDRERIEEGLELVDRAWPAAKKDEALFVEASLLRGVALNQLGDCAEALARFEQVLEVDPDNGEARLEKAIALFELGRFDLATADFEKVTRDWADEPWGFHYLGLIAERRGQGSEARAFFEKARRLAPDDFPKPVHLDPSAFDQAVKDAIDALPTHAKPHLANVVLSVEPLPSEDEIREGLSPTILGVFQGTPIDERSPVDAAQHQTARITLFQNNLERFARTRDELIEEIGVTVLHEVGHLLGLDEDELYARGLD